MPGTPEPDHYTVLGVQRAASGHDIKAAFKRLAKAYHPDKNADGEALFKEVSAAYEVLGDEKSLSPIINANFHPHSK
ncbi:Chaperone protein DnaJ [Diplonema papillatum]|nr:Chaperone protein DnaJ [Diplonema papillatum]